jgi:hypothetical protein
MMSLLTKKFQLTRSESFFRELEEPLSSEMDVTDDENQTSTKKRKQDDIDGIPNSLVNPILVKIEKQVLKHSRDMSQKYNNDLKAFYKLDIQTSKIVTHFNQGTLPTNLKLKPIVNQYPLSFKKREVHIRDEQRIFLTALHAIVEARAKFYVAEFESFQENLQQNYSPDKLKLELTEFATQQIPSDSIFEHGEISIIVEKVFAGYIKHNEATLSNFENTKSTRNPIDIPSDGEEEEINTQKQHLSDHNKSNNKNINNTKTEQNKNTNNTTKKHTEKQQLSLEEQFKRIVIELNDVTTELKLSRKQQNRDNISIDSGDNRSHNRGRSRDRKSQNNNNNREIKSTQNNTKNYQASSECSHEERRQSVATDRSGSMKPSLSSRYNNDNQSPPRNNYHKSDNHSTGSQGRSRSASRNPRGRDL